MSKYTFISEDDLTSSKLTLEFEALSLDELLPRFEDFLRGSGFVFDGYIGIVDEEPELVDLEFDDVGENVFSNMVSELKSCSRCGLSRNDLNTNVCLDQNCPMTKVDLQSKNDADQG
jgi:hypothetical protein